MLLPPLADLKSIFTIVKAIAGARVGGDHTSGATCLSIRPSDGRVLLIKSSYRRSWAMPGGFIDAGEQPIDGAQRELMEETGTEISSIELVYHRAERFHHDYLFSGFAAGDPTDAPPTWEIEDHDWVLPSEALTVHGSLHSMTRLAFENIPGGLEQYVQGRLQVQGSLQSCQAEVKLPILREP